MRPLASFFALTFAVSWACFAGVAIVARSTQASTLPATASALALLGTLAPGLIALFLTAQREGRASLARLLARIVQWRVGGRWYVFALGYLTAVRLAAAVLHRLVSGEWPAFGDEPSLVMLASVAVSTPLQAGEEIGWRGYALPRLASRLGLPRASVLVGAVVGIWHLPLFFVPGSNAGQPFLLFALGSTALSVALAWLYVRTGGSLLLAMLMHSAVNNTRRVVPTAIPGASDPWSLDAPLILWLVLALMWVGAAYFLARMPRYNQACSSSSYSRLSS